MPQGIQRLRQSRVRFGVVGLNLDGAFEGRRGQLELRFRGFPVVVAAEQVRVLRLWLDDAYTLQPRFFLRSDLNADFVRDRLRDLGLKIQHVRRLAVEGPRPEMTIRGGVDELDRHAHASVDPLDGAVNDRVDAQLAADLRHRLVRIPVPHDRCARGHAQRVNLRQTRDQRLGRAVGQKLLVGIARQIPQREDRDGSNGGRVHRCGGRPHVPRQRAEGQNPKRQSGDPPAGAAWRDDSHLSRRAKQPPEIDDELAHALIALSRFGGQSLFDDGAERYGNVGGQRLRRRVSNFFQHLESGRALERMPVRE